MAERATPSVEKLGITDRSAFPRATTRHGLAPVPVPVPVPVMVCNYEDADPGLGGQQFDQRGVKMVDPPVVCIPRWYAPFPCQGEMLCIEGTRSRGLLGTRGRTGLASAVSPVLVGVIFAFAWNMAGSHAPETRQPAAGLAPTAGTAVDQAADQAWASATPFTTRCSWPPHIARSAESPWSNPGPAAIGPVQRVWSA